jgi:hypothetical protein
MRSPCCARAASGHAVAAPPSQRDEFAAFHWLAVHAGSAKCGFLLMPSDQEIATGEMG